MSSEIYELMKRSDEVEVVEKAHRRPRFVEDCVREMIAGVVARFPQLDGASFVSRPPGEPRDDPPAQRRRRAPRAARELRGEIEIGRASARTTRRSRSGSNAGAPASLTLSRRAARARLRLLHAPAQRRRSSPGPRAR